MKIYTKQGDGGSTSIYGGGTVLKSVLRIDALGEIDELNAFIGLCIAELQNLTPKILHQTQHTLFTVGAIVSCNPEAKNKNNLPPFSLEAITDLEKEIDKMEIELVPLQYFILPGGNKVIANIHIARAVCRRAERACVALNEKQNLENQNIIIYLNRLSDYLFVLARYVCHITGVKEIAWQKERKL